MNHIYKSIFNKALGVFTAVPEFASAHGKGSERTVVGRVAKGTAGFAASALAISVGLALTSTSAVAAPGIFINNGQDPACLAVIDDVATSALQLIYGGSKTIYPAVGVAAGSPLGTKSNFELDARNPCLPTGGTDAENHNTQTNRTLFYNSKNLTLGGRLDVNSGIIGVGDRGADGAGATNSIRMGTGTTLADANKQLNAISIGVDAGASANNATAIGSATTAKTGYSTALGFQSQAGDPAVTNFNGEYATAIGGKAKALHAYTTALGAETNASGAYATAVGNEAKATKESTTAVGDRSKAINEFATALGHVALASGKNSTALGTRNEALGEEATAIGYHSHANGSQQLAIGAHAGRNLDGSFSQSTHGISIGSLAGADNATAKSNDDSVLIGTESGRYAQGGNRNTSIGKSAGQYLNGSDNIAMGTQAGTGTATDKLEVSNTVAIGNTAKASGNDGIALGNTANSKTDGAISIGTRSVSGDGDAVPGVTPIGNKSISIGYDSVANRYDTIAMGVEASTQAADSAVAPWDAIAIGSKSKATTYKALAIGAYSQATGRQSTVIGNDIQGQNSTASGTRSQILGVQSNVSGDNSVSIGDTNTVASARTYAMGNNINAAAGTDDSLAFGTKAGVGGPNAIALGNTAKASAANTVAISNQAQAKTPYSVALGASAVAGDDSTGALNGGEAAIAIGRQAVANVYNGIAIGKQATIKKDSADGIAIGAETKVNAYKGAAIGAFSEANGSQALAIGNNKQGQSSVASGERSQVIGVESTVSGNNSVAIGDKNTVASARTYAIGNNINVAAGANDSLAFGTRAHVSGANQVSIGKDAGADAAVPNTSGIVIGESAGRYLEGGTRNTAIGERAGQYVKGSYNIAMGTNAGSRTATDTLVVDDSTSIGHNAKAVTSESIAIGKNAESGKVDKFDGKKATAIGHEAKALGTGNIAMGAYATSENGHDGVAIGTYVKSSNVKAIAIGAYSSASGVQSIAIANNYNSDNSYASNKSTATGVRAIVMGAESHATAERALAIGDKNTVASARTYAIGNNINVAAGADDSLVFGTRAAVGAENTVAIGANANAAQANSVALGAGSATSDVNTGDYTLTTSYTAAGQPVAANGTVSVGSAGKERQIQNVAAGVISATSTDAINGSQLYATNNYMNNFAGDVKTKLGGNAALGNDGHLTMTNIGGTGENTVDDAIKNLKTAIDNKADTTASVTSENQADIKVDKEAPVGNTTNYKLSLGGDAKAKLAKAATALQTVEGDSNITATKDATDPTKVKLALNKNLTADSVTLGDKAGDHAVVNKDGLTIANGPSVKKDGINAGNKKITGVANGNVAAGSTDAVNGGQLAEVKSKADSAVQNVVSANPTALTANKVGDTVTLTPNFIAGDLVNADGTVNTPAAADEGKLVSAKAVADALKANHFVVDTKANGGKTETGSEADAKVGSSNKVTFEAGKNLIAKQANTANGGATVKFSLQDDISLNSVTAGTGDSQVVLNDAGVNVGNKNYINKDGLNANGNKVANVKAGDVSATSTDAVNGAQLHNVATSVANVLGGNAAVDGNGNVTSSNIGGTGANTVDDAIKAVNATAAKHTTVVEGKNVKVTKGKNAAGGDEYTVATKDDLDVTSVTAGNTTVNTNGLTITGGPSVTRGGIDAGNRIISGVKAGDVSATSQEAVNGSQLHATNTKLDGVKAKADTAVQDVKSGDENALTAVKDPNTNIVTVTPKLSGDLVDANGNITAPTTPADKGKLVTAGTVADALANTHFVVDTKATDGELDAASQADQKIKAGNKVTLQAGKNLKAKQTNGANGAQVEFSLKDSISLKEVTAGEGANQVVLGNDGVKVGGNTYINNNGLNANGNKITNVADGVDPTDAVNKGQLDAVKTVADSAVKSVDVANGEQNLVVDNSDPKNPKLSLKKDLTVDSVKAGDSTLNTDGLTIAGGPSVKKDGIDAGDKKITNVAPGAVTPTSKDAVNGSQLYNVANNVKDLIGPDATIDPATGKVAVADPTKGIGETGKGTIGDAIKHVNDAAKAAADTAKKHSSVKAGDNIVVTEGTNAAGGKEYTVSTAKDLNVDSVKAGDTTVNNDGLTIAGGPSVKKDGIDAGDKNITNVADGNVAAGSKDAVNGGQLYDVAKNVADLVGPDATIDPATGKVTVADPTKGIGETGKGTIGDAIKAVNDLAKKAAAEKTTVKAKDGRSNVTVTEGTNAAGGHEYTVDVERAVTEAGSDQVTVTSKHDADSNTTTYTVDVSDKTKASLAKADSAVQGLTSKDGNLNFNKGPNGNVEVSFNDNLNVKNITTDGVKAGDTTINSNGVEIVNGPSMTKDGINAGGKAITNVANGNLAKGSKDAVNGGQLHETAQSVADVIGGGATVKDGKVVAGQNGIGNTGQNTVHGAIAAINQNTANNFNQIRGDLRKMDRDLRGGIAGALATAGLPQAFRPGKSMVAAAASTYRGQSGLAIGVSRISDNGKVILKVTGNTNSRGDFGGTIGAGYQW